MSKAKQWSKTTLGDCTTVTSGATPKTGVSKYWDGDICWITPKDISDLEGKFLTVSSRKITKEGLASCAATVLPVGSVLFSSRAPIGLVAIAKTPTATNQGCKSFIPNEELVDSEYLYYWLKANKSRIENLGVGATFKEVNKKVVESIEISLPPLPEQKRIAAILDSADAIRTKRKAAIAKIDQLEHSLFVSMFGEPTLEKPLYPQCPLSALVRPNDSICYGVVQPGEDFENGVPLIRVGDIQDGKVSITSIKRISPKIEAQYKRSRLNGSEILLSCVGTTGNIALVDESKKGFNIARAVARIPLNEDVDRAYIAEYLRSRTIQHYFHSELRTVSQPTLNIKQIQETLISCPPLGMQKLFSHRVEGITKLKGLQQDAARSESELFSSLQHRAFTGEL